MIGVVKWFWFVIFEGCVPDSFCRLVEDFNGVILARYGGLICFSFDGDVGVFERIVCDGFNLRFYMYSDDLFDVFRFVVRKLGYFMDLYFNVKSDLEDMFRDLSRIYRFSRSGRIRRLVRKWLGVKNFG